MGGGGGGGGGRIIALFELLNCLKELFTSALLTFASFLNSKLGFIGQWASFDWHLDMGKCCQGLCQGL